MPKTYTVPDGDYIGTRIDIPEGYAVVTEGRVEHRDMLYNKVANTFEPAHKISIGVPVSSRICVIRRQVRYTDINIDFFSQIKYI